MFVHSQVIPKMNARLSISIFLLIMVLISTLGASQSKLMMGRLIHAKAEGTSGKHEVNIMANMAVKTNVHAKVEPVLDQERRRHQVSVPKGNSESGGSIQVH